MFGWLRDALTSSSPSLSYRHSMIQAPFLHQQQQQNHKKNQIFSPSDDDDDDDGTDEEFNDHSFYNNPYHSSGQMNYTDVPQQQYTNEHTYPTYLAQQQISNDITTNQSLDDQIHAKLLSLQQRGNHLQSYPHKHYNYAYRNRILPTLHLSSVSNVDRENNQEQKEDDNYRIPAYYPGQYPNIDENSDFASTVLWYRNVMRSVKKLM